MKLIGSLKKWFDTKRNICKLIGITYERYLKWVKRGRSEYKPSFSKENLELVRKTFINNNEIYGAPRIAIKLKKQNNWKLLLMDFNAQISMSRVENCLDNAVIESFYAILKTEGLKRRYPYAKELINDFNNFIIWYNTKRISLKTGLAPTHII